MLRKMGGCFLCMVMVCAMSSALAKQWGLSGEILTFVQGSGAFDEYTTIVGYTPDVPCFALDVSNAQERVLVLVERDEHGRLKEAGRYPAALLQPGEGKRSENWVKGLDNGFMITPMWSENGEHYTFGTADGSRADAEHLVLTQAKHGMLCYTLMEDGATYRAEDGFTAVVWQAGALNVYHLMFQTNDSGEEISLTWGEAGGGYRRYQ